VTPRIYVTQPIFDQVLERLKRDAKVDCNTEERVLTKEELRARLQDADGAMTLLTDILDRPLLEACPNLKVAANFAVGFNNVDLAAASDLGIAITNTPGVLTETTADFAWALLMAVARRVVEGDKFTRAGKFKAWGPKMFLGHDVFGKTLGLIGLGRIGQAVARRAGGFGMKIVFYDAESVPAGIVNELRAERLALDELLRVSDFISLHVPLLDTTRHLLNDGAFAAMKPNCIVVNTSRGPVVDEKALVRALSQGTIAGAGLDVFEREPQIEPELLEMDNVVLAPHIASASHETRLKMCNMAADNLLAVLKGQRPPNLVNTDVWERRRQ
jgi:glyoxylate reductase